MHSLLLSLVSLSEHLLGEYVHTLCYAHWPPFYTDKLDWNQSKSDSESEVASKLAVVTVVVVVVVVVE